MNEIRFYLKLLRQRLPVMAALILLCSTVGSIVASRLPTLYESSATLLVEGAQIPDNMLRSVVQVDSLEQLEVIQRRLLTRANLLDVARENNVFPNISQMSPDEIVEEMRARTTVRRASGRDLATVMTISFEGPNRQQVATVVNNYVTIALSTNSRFRAERAQGTLDFFEQEVERLTDNLRLQNQKIVEYKNENTDALPESFEYRLSRQTLLQERLTRIERDIEQLEDQRANIQRVFEATGNIQSSNATLTPEQRQLASLEAELQTGLAVYSEQNPRIRMLRSRIDALKGQIAATAETGTDETVNSETAALDLSLAEIDTQMNSLREEEEEIEAELEKLETSLSRTPAVRIALEAMERERANLEALHSDATQQLNQARMGERIELSARGERITVLEPPSVPDAPSSPNRMAVVGMGFIVGLGLSGAFFLFLEFTNNDIRRPTDITSAIEVKPLMTLPLLETESQRRWRRISQVAVLLLVMTLVPAALWTFDTYYIPLDVLYDRLMDRLF